MTAALLWNVAVLLSIWLPVAPSVPCGLSIHPVDPVVPYGGFVTLNCSTSCANETDLKWESSAQGEIQKAAGWTSVRFVNLTAWDFRPVCYGDPERKSVNMPVYLYQFSSPDIHLASEIVAGRRHTVTCNISNLKVHDPIPNINMSLTSGGHILNSSESNSSVEYSSVAQFVQDGAEILCTARLRVGKEVLEKRANSTLKVSAPPYNISIVPNVTTYKAGSNITVTCHAEGKPFPKFAWDLPSTDKVEFSDSNRTITVHSAQSSHNGTYRCHAQNAYGNDSACIDIFYEGKSRSWVTTVVVVVVVFLLAAVLFICYQCRK